jgi:SWI/SNF-related matrix-associated actin-dependent regulator 1 of chromatin subfamily A
MVHLSVLRQAIGRAKIPVVVEFAEGVLDADEDTKIVIYAVHRHVVAQLEQLLRKYGVTTITGDVPNEERSVRCDRFQNMHMPRVMIISSAGGEGIDLYRSSVIIFAEREWSPAVEEQAEARCHRIGQKGAVEAIYVIAQDTIDEDIDELIESKRAILGQVISQADVHLDITDELLSRVMRKGGK